MDNGQLEDRQERPREAAKRRRLSPPATDGRAVSAEDPVEGAVAAAPPMTNLTMPNPMTSTAATALGMASMNVNMPLFPMGFSPLAVLNPQMATMLMNGITSPVVSQSSVLPLSPLTVNQLGSSHTGTPGRASTLDWLATVAAAAANPQVVAAAMSAVPPGFMHALAQPLAEAAPPAATTASSSQTRRARRLSQLAAARQPTSDTNVPRLANTPSAPRSGSSGSPTDSDENEGSSNSEQAPQMEPIDEEFRALWANSTVSSIKSRCGRSFCKNAFVVFANTHRKEVDEILKRKGEELSEKRGLVNSRAVIRKLGDLWRRLKDDERAPYNAVYTEQKSRRERRERRMWKKLSEED